jgi:hypothetical protein
LSKVCLGVSLLGVPFRWPIWACLSRVRTGCCWSSGRRPDKVVGRSVLPLSGFMSGSPTRGLRLSMSAHSKVRTPAERGPTSTDLGSR